MNTENNILGHLQSAAIRSYSNTSFSPEKRGVQMIQDYSEELAADIAELRSKEVSEESIYDYKSRYERFFAGYLGAKSRTFSVMITGAGNFPVRRHEKANRSEQRHYEIFREWRIRAKKSIVRKMQPVKTFVSELDRYKAELAGMKRNHELMKACNVIIKKAKGKDCVPELIQAGLSEENARKLLVNRFGYVGYASFSLTNNNANMKRVEGMIKTLEQKETARETNPVTKYTFEGGEMVIDYDIDRIQIFFTNRPSTDELNAWKAKGLNSFNWSPSAKAWQRKITANALHAVKAMLTGITKVS